MQYEQGKKIDAFEKAPLVIVGRSVFREGPRRSISQQQADALTQEES